ncbi:MAG: hypothetical protein ACR2FN_09075 [Chitinophagaceae bacterium]
MKNSETADKLIKNEKTTISEENIVANLKHDFSKLDGVFDKKQWEIIIEVYGQRFLS